jgi:hypothetical protein
MLLSFTSPLGCGIETANNVACFVRIFSLAYSTSYGLTLHLCRERAVRT